MIGHIHPNQGPALAAKCQDEKGRRGVVYSKKAHTSICAMGD